MIENATRSAGARALAQDHTVVARVPDSGLQATDPALIRLPSGRLLASWAFRDQGGPGDPGWDAEPASRCRLALSADDGRTWEPLPALNVNTGRPFVHQGRLYLLADGHGRRNLLIMRSDDEGATWTAPVRLFTGSFWNAPAATAVRNGRLYVAYGAPDRSGRYNRSGSRLVIAVGDLSRDPMDPANWRLSTYAVYPGTPDTLRAGLNAGEDHWLEPNVVNVRGSLRLLARVRIDHQATTNMAAVCDLDDDGSEAPELTFRQFYPVPGGQGNFHVLHDAPSGLFWMTSNLATDSQNTDLERHLRERGFTLVSGGLGDERRILMLSYSVDALNWFNAGCLAMADNPLQSFHYVAPLVDGEDLLFLSRTSRDAPNQHDSDLITFHRLPQFRALALSGLHLV